VSVRDEVCKRADIVFGHGRPISGVWEPRPWRYVPKSFNGGTDWGVWDAKEKKYVCDAALVCIPVETLRDELLFN
jgi:hypothetical protein